MIFDHQEFDTPPVYGCDCLDCAAARASGDRFELRSLTTAQPPLADAVQHAGWQDVKTIPSGDGLVAIGYDSSHQDWAIVVEADGGGAIEAYQITRHPGTIQVEAGPRTPATTLPTPEQAVGDWETRQHAQ